MASIENPTELKIEHLLHSVKQLSPVELDEFTRKLTEWQQQREALVSEDVDPNASDATILAFIRKNSQLPENENRRYWELRRKSDDETLTDDELPEYRELVLQLTVMNTKRLEALAILVKRWERPVEEIMAELGLVIARDPQTGRRVPLFNPRLKKWNRHFMRSEDFLSIVGRTRVGRATVETLNMNRFEEINIRTALRVLRKYPPEDALSN